MNKTISTYCIILFLQLYSIAYSQDINTNIVDVFQNGENEYTCFRIPSIVQSKTGILLAFAEGRKNSCSDTGDIDLVLKRSEDGGKTWSSIITVWDDSENVCGNPSPVVDRQTGRIILLSCWNLGTDNEKDIINNVSKDTRKVFTIYSDDDGISWSTPKDITSSVKKENWTWYATGPCHGIQLQNYPYNGRIVVPANHSVSDTKEYHSHNIYSDDGGATWNLGGVVNEQGGNESSVVELSNGELMLNMRNYNRDISKTRAFAKSKDGGETWSKLDYDLELIEPLCQGSILNHTSNGKITNKIFFSNPSSVSKREMISIQFSSDDANTWEQSYLIYPGPGAYSDLVNISDSQIGILFEYGINSPYEKIGFSSLSVYNLK